MNRWRGLGICLFLIGVAALVAPPFSALAQDKDKTADKGEKDKQAEKVEKDKDKPAEKGEKDKDKDKDKPAEKGEKDKTTKEEGKGESLNFTAFKSGSPPFWQELTTKTDQTMKVMGQEVVQTQKQTFIIKWTPEKEDDKGNYVVTQEITAVKMDIDIGGQKISYDSNSPKQSKNPMTDFFEALTKSKLTFVISKDLKVEDVKGREAFIKNLGETNPQMEQLLKAILSKDALTKMAEPTWWALPPDGKATKGQTWTKPPTVLNLGPIGKYTTNFTFTYDGPDGKLDKIGIKADLKYAPPDGKEAAGLPFVIKDAKDLQSKSASGTALFNRDKGRFDSSDMDMRLTGDLTIMVSNMTTQISLDQTQKSSSKTYDSDPLQAPKK